MLLIVPPYQTASRPSHRGLRAAGWFAGLLGLGLWAVAGVFALRALVAVPPPVPASLAPEVRSLTVATVEGSLPLSGTDATGRPAGVHVALARAVCDVLGLTCRFALVKEDLLVDRLESGAVDMIAADVRVSPEALRRVRFVTPHARTASVVVGSSVMWDEMPPLAQPGSFPALLSGRLVAVASGSAQARSLRLMAPARTAVVLAETHDAALAALTRGEADAAMLPLAVVLDTLERVESRSDLLRMLSGPIYRDGAGGAVALAVAPGDRRLADAVERALETLRRSGRLRAILGRHPDPMAALPPLAGAGAVP